MSENEQKAGCVEILDRVIDYTESGKAPEPSWLPQLRDLRAALEAAALSPARSGEAVSELREKWYEIARDPGGTDDYYCGRSDAYFECAEDLFTLGAYAPRNESSGVSPGVDLCEVARELERVHVANVIREVAAIAGERADAYWSSHSLACEEIAFRLNLTPAPQDSVRVGDSLAIEQDALLELADRLQKARRVPQSAADNRISPTQTLTTPAPAAGADGEELIEVIRGCYERMAASYHEDRRILFHELGFVIDAADKFRFRLALSDGAGQSAGGGR